MLIKLGKILFLWISVYLLLFGKLLFFEKLLKIEIDSNIFSICFDLSLFIIVFLYLFYFKVNVFKIFKKIEFKHLLICTLLVVSFLVIYPFLNILYLVESVSKEVFLFPLNLNLSIFEQNSSYYFIRTLFIVPVLEELFYRYIIQNKFKTFLSTFWSVFFTSFLFSLGHLDVENFFTFIFSSIFLGYIYHFSKNLSLCLYVHILLNFLINLTSLEISNFNYFYNLTLIIIAIFFIVFLINKLKIK